MGRLSRTIFITDLRYLAFLHIENIDNTCTMKILIIQGKIISFLPSLRPYPSEGTKQISITPPETPILYIVNSHERHYPLTSSLRSHLPTNAPQMSNILILVTGIRSPSSVPSHDMLIVIYPSQRAHSFLQATPVNNRPWFQDLQARSKTLSLLIHF